MKTVKLYTLCNLVAIPLSVAFTINKSGTTDSNRHAPLRMASINQETSSISDRREFGQSVLLSVLTAATIAPLPSRADATVTAVQPGGKITYGSEAIMSNKAHGSTETPVQENLRFGVSRKTADRICSYNRRFAEYAGYFQESTLRKELLQAQGPTTFYDSVTGKPLFVAPVGRSVDEFLKESEYHGWPSFRDQEVVWENVRIIKGSGETVSVDGTHLGHNIPD
eukprot:CAMPEP_0172507434 /NCGR_PEP_ID=MMETSP1066-20121228/203701_1 /TAXON_ID=671091 /ORGANISM="Coscinodiscus wailesii, Strain CCMP2513" /LENGTH=223 /DNA_ID=CAMNT_0013284987 /DNA_START=48 /DNA_END=716 /DNA_ORIENTATION=+